MNRFELHKRDMEALVPTLRRFALALTRDRADADDLVQDCLVLALDRWQQRRPDASLKSWLMTILHNRFISLGRARTRAGRSIAVDEMDVEPAAADEAGPRAELRDVWAGMARLPLDQRVVLTLVAVEGLSYEEAATTLDIPIGTVMSRLARAREGLRAYMETGSTVVLRRIK